MHGEELKGTSKSSVSCSFVRADTGETPGSDAHLPAGGTGGLQWKSCSALLLVLNNLVGYPHWGVKSRDGLLVCLLVCETTLPSVLVDLNELGAAEGWSSLLPAGLRVGVVS